MIKYLKTSKWEYSLASTEWLFLPLFPGCIEIWESCFFVEGGKPEYPEKNPTSRDEKQQLRQTQLTYGVNTGNKNPGQIGGRRVLSPLRHPW